MNTHPITFGDVLGRSQASISAGSAMTTALASWTPPVITPEVARWTLGARANSASVDAIVQQMVGSGWQPRDAVHVAGHAPGGLIDILTNDAVRKALATASQQQPSYLGPGPALDDPRYQPAPAPLTLAGPDTTELFVLGRRIRVLTYLESPRVVVFEGLLTADECTMLRDQAACRLERSATLDAHSGHSQIHDARTSRGCFLERGSSELVKLLDARLAHLCDWPEVNGEDLQILHYGPGAEYKPHYDYFDPAHPGNQPVLRRGGQRVGTVVMYLNTPGSGGATVFPDIGLSVQPIMGNAVFFNYDRPHPVTRSLHGGAPVLTGEKWVATRWYRQRRFV